jgi:hypothetical protein
MVDGFCLSGVPTASQWGKPMQQAKGEIDGRFRIARASSKEARGK